MDIKNLINNQLGFNLFQLYFSTTNYQVNQ